MKTSASKRNETKIFFKENEREKCAAQTLAKFFTVSFRSILLLGMTVVIPSTWIKEKLVIKGNREGGAWNGKRRTEEFGYGVKSRGKRKREMVGGKLKNKKEIRRKEK